MSAMNSDSHANQQARSPLRRSYCYLCCCQTIIVFLRKTSCTGRATGSPVAADYASPAIGVQLDAELLLLQLILLFCVISQLTPALT
jgi:hypothetical protein